ncbi:16S rRNA (guanine(966)-N(2))-methyltransferase RsmD [Motilimonas cestriensis]|uniref:Ribosomal RNA small subunit methyltransferase D n=1 Tax=Motilimonas cestriensis TaxID=2742685 RepID=A0ABS8WFX6_9GAMM|nr:16S rRNA (guanine(966)-N(2))-methyltransferase RsmD [Motilimonas cestriensis]MCE2597340.1 16S rRNA (guanine(966)-N(2))-methyltransferase RsmD [Motilimonas cestriensis]
MGTNQRLRSKQKAINPTKDGQIRIIAGQWRGRKLPVKDLEGLRPTTDRVKETVFNWLAMDIREANCLDCFSGSGSLAFEALSRYASTAVLIEKDKLAAKQLETNLAAVKASNGKVVCTDSLAYLSKPANQQFDIVFVDPPFRKGLLEPCCEQLESNNWLSMNALIYIEREKELTQPKLPFNWQLIKDKTAGQVIYQVYQRQA